MRRHLATPASAALWLALPILVIVAAALAIAMHRNGHTQGDDFALYLRQARSLFDGDPAQVVADNRFSVLNSDNSFSPIAYPWVWPLLLSPFVHLWGFDYDRLKLVEVALFCVWLVLLHGIVRRRIGRLAAVAIVAVFATAPVYLQHTDQLLTEIPHLVALAAVIWWYDRIRARGSLLDATTFDLAMLGTLVMLCFNLRRESLVLLGVIAVMQVYDLVRERVGIGERWQTLLTPYVAFAASATVFQLLLPTDLLPDNGNSTSFLDDRLGEYPGILSDQLGLGVHRWIGVTILLLALAGIVVGIRRRPTLDGPLVLLALLSAVAISTHLRQVDRYWMQITPWVVYFGTVACIEAARAASSALPRRARERAEEREQSALSFSRRKTVAVLGIIPLLAVLIAHVVVLPSEVGAARDYNAAGRMQSGPSNPVVAPIFDAVNELTPPDSIIAYFRARTMTLLTDRRSFQTKHLDRITQNADYFAQRRDSTYWQPTFTTADARLAGWEEVWSDPRWILWRIPHDG